MTACTTANGAARAARARKQSPLRDGGGSARRPRAPETPKNTRETRRALSVPAAIAPASSVQSSGSLSASIDKEDDEQNVKVLVRIRPVNERERCISGDVCSLRQLGNSHLYITIDGRVHEYQFDGILGPGATQEAVFEAAGKPMVASVMQGFNACCFAYGQTGAGKTYTMQGVLGPNPTSAPAPARGLAPRVLAHLFEAIRSCQAAHRSVKYTCTCSFLQIYNEQVSDLLATRSRPLALRFDAGSGVHVENLTETSVTTAEDAIRLMLKGIGCRRVTETNANHASSRSHSVFTLRVACESAQESGRTTRQVAALHMVDLAGSERIRVSGASGAARAEASDINLSLTALGRVITKVVETQRLKADTLRHIPYRDSKLTFLLQDSLGGNARAVLIANVSPSVSCAQETLSTLQFADRAKRVRNRATINAELRGMKKLQRDMDGLRLQLSRAHDGAPCPGLEDFDELRAMLAASEVARERAGRDLERAAEECRQLKAHNCQLKDELKVRDGELAGCKEKLAALATKQICLAQPGVTLQPARDDGSHAHAQHASQEAAAFPWKLHLVPNSPAVPSGGQLSFGGHPPGTRSSPAPASLDCMAGASCDPEQRQLRSSSAVSRTRDQTPSKNRAGTREATPASARSFNRGGRHNRDGGSVRARTPSGHGGSTGGGTTAREHTSHAAETPGLHVKRAASLQPVRSGAATEPGHAAAARNAVQAQHATELKRVQLDHAAAVDATRRELRQRQRDEVARVQREYQDVIETQRLTHEREVTRLQAKYAAAVEQLQEELQWEQEAAVSTAVEIVKQQHVIDLAHQRALHNESMEISALLHEDEARASKESYRRRISQLQGRMESLRFAHAQDLARMLVRLEDLQTTGGGERREQGKLGKGSSLHPSLRGFIERSNSQSASRGSTRSGSGRERQLGDKLVTEENCKVGWAGWDSSTEHNMWTLPCSWDNLRREQSSGRGSSSYSSKAHSELATMDLGQVPVHWGEDRFTR